MKIRIRYLGCLHDELGKTNEYLDIPETVRTLDGLRQYLSRRGALWENVLSEKRGIKMAKQYRQATGDALLEEGNEIAFFPPVSGG